MSALAILPDKSYPGGMADQSKKSPLPEVPKQIFEQFLVGLEAADIPAAVVGRLREALFSGDAITERRIKEAIAPDAQS